MSEERAASVTIEALRAHERLLRDDLVAVEEPLQIELAQLSGASAPEIHPIAVTMRTPGDDLALALGFLHGEGLVHRREDIVDVVRCQAPPESPGSGNVITLYLAEHLRVDTEALRRHVYTTSSCGICGKASIEAVATRSRYLPLSPGPRVSDTMLRALPARLRQAQEIFDRTGGLHAAGLVSASSGECVEVAEDVGRHNAVDKIVGRAMRAGLLPLGEHILVLSGRASFELVQKAVMAGVPIVVAVGAPSSLAIALARDSGATLCGFARHDRLNIYSGAERLRGADR